MAAGGEDSQATSPAGGQGTWQQEAASGKVSGQPSCKAAGRAYGIGPCACAVGPIGCAIRIMAGHQYGVGRCISQAAEAEAECVPAEGTPAGLVRAGDDRFARVRITMHIDAERCNAAARRGVENMIGKTMRTAMVLLLLAMQFPAVPEPRTQARFSACPEPSPSPAPTTPRGWRRSTRKSAQATLSVPMRRAKTMIRMSDRSTVALRPEHAVPHQRLRVRREGRRFTVLDPAARRGVRMVTGLVGKSHPENYTVQANMATIGIRGTDFEVAILEEGSSDGRPGVYSAVNDGGTTVRIVSGERVDVEKDQTAFAPAKPGTGRSAPAGARHPSGLLPRRLRFDDASGDQPADAIDPVHASLSGRTGQPSARQLKAQPRPLVRPAAARMIEAGHYHPARRRYSRQVAGNRGRRNDRIVAAGKVRLGICLSDAATSAGLCEVRSGETAIEVVHATVSSGAATLTRQDVSFRRARDQGSHGAAA